MSEKTWHMTMQRVERHEKDCTAIKSKTTWSGFRCLYCGTSYEFLDDANYHEKIDTQIGHVSTCEHNPMVAEIVKLHMQIVELQTELLNARKPARKAKK